MKGKGGFAALFLENDLISFSGHEKDTTNNRMELLAVIIAIIYCNRDCEYIIYSDSKVTINCAEGGWKRNKNLDLWKEYDKVKIGKRYKFEWVKGHSGNKWNDMADRIAKEEALLN